MPKSFLYRWSQRAWTPTANTRQIQAAWAKSGLFPLDQAMMDTVKTTPEPASHQIEPETPHSARTIQSSDCRVRQYHDNTTVMTPNLESAQVHHGPGSETGQHEGELNGKGLVKLVSAVEVMRAAAQQSGRRRRTRGW